MRPSHLLPALFAISFAAPASAASLGAPPPTAKRPVTDEHHGVKVTEDYRWLENADDPEVKQWTEAQNKHTRAYFSQLPGRARLLDRLKGLYSSKQPGYSYLIRRQGRLFAWKFQPPLEQSLLVFMPSPDEPGAEKVILDPNAREPKGQVAMDWYVPSPDGSLVAVSLSENGSEEGTLHFFETATGRELPDKIARVQYPTGGGSVAWAPDGKSVFYTRYPRKGERPDADLDFYEQVFVHRLGEPESMDRYSTGKAFPRIAEIELDATDDGRWVICTVANGDGGEYDHHILDLSQPDVTAWRRLTTFDDDVKHVAASHDGAHLYLRSVQGAPHGKILRMPATGTLKEAVVVVPEGPEVIESFTVGESHLYVTDLVGGPNQIRRFNLDGTGRVLLPLPPSSGTGYVMPHGADKVLFRITSYTAPDAYHLYDAKSGTLKKTALAETSPADFSDIEVVREEAVSKDGTRVPMSILRKKGVKLDGNNPLLLTGYGGYGISMGPYFEPMQRLWFDAGGVHVTAHIRGGGEYGEEWHLAGNLTKKQNVFDDFAACARRLIELGYTRPEKLAVEGGSNGGLLMGAFLTQNPALARAAVAHVGVFDMVRSELEPNGEFNVTEFGSVKDLAQFQAIYAYSPYHRVVDGTKYPAVFLLAGATDGRVDASNSRKMAARLQAATGSTNPVLLRLSEDSGHGMGTALSETLEQQADVYAFLFDQLGIPF